MVASLLRGDKPLTTEERRMVFRVATVIAIPLATVVVLALLVGFGIWRHQTNQRISANKAQIAQQMQLTNELNRERRDRERAIALAVFKTCVENEAQDGVLVGILNKTIQAMLKTQRTAARDAYIQTLRDAIRAREPTNETECKIPAGGG